MLMFLQSQTQAVAITEHFAEADAAASATDVSKVSVRRP